MDRNTFIILTMTEQAAGFYIDLLESYLQEHPMDTGVRDDLAYLRVEAERKGWLPE